MAPVSLILRNISNKAINNKSEIWGWRNSQYMLVSLRGKNKALYMMMCAEILTTIVSLCTLFFSVLLS
jgi:hypothetical protein